MKNCQRLKLDIWNLIDNGKYVIDGVSHATNNDHQAYKDPLPKHEKGESSKNGKAQVNYTYSNQNYGYPNVDNVINMVKIKENDKDLNHPHYLALHIEVMIHKNRVRCVLIDGGVELNICPFNILENLGYSKQDIDTRQKVTIRAYDGSERQSKGLVFLPILIDLVERDILFHVVDTSTLSYNILLGRPWIHEMKVVPSTYHRCVTFAHNEIDMCILGVNTLAINNISIESHIPLDRVSDMR